MRNFSLALFTLVIRAPVSASVHFFKFFTLSFPLGFLRPLVDSEFVGATQAVAEIFATVHHMRVSLESSAIFTRYLDFSGKIRLVYVQEVLALPVYDALH